MSAGEPVLLTVRRAVPWAIAIIGAATVWLGPPVLHSIYMLAVGIYILVWGPQWFRLSLATILGAFLVVAGLVLAMALLTA